MVEIIVIGWDGRTGFGEIDTTQDECPTSPLVPALTIVVDGVLEVDAFVGTIVFAQLSVLPDLVHLYETPETLRITPTLVHFVPKIDDAYEVVTFEVLATAKANATTSAMAKLRPLILRTQKV